MGDFFAFRRMLAPVLIHIVFWVGVLGSLALGGLIIADKIDKGYRTSLPDAIEKVYEDTRLYFGLAIMIGGPLFFRLYCELLMLPFRINGTLTDIRSTLIAQQEGTSPGTSRR